MIKVLVVDDEAPIRKWLKHCITQFDGFSYIEAASAQEAIKIFQVQRPEIVITDIEMPGINGLEMLRMIQQDDTDIYSIVLTSHEVFDYARTALNLGSVKYVLKTEITEKSLHEVMEKAKSVIQEHDRHNWSGREHFMQAIALHENPDPITPKMLYQQGILLDMNPIIAIDYWNGDNDKAASKYMEELPYLENSFTFTLDANHLIVISNVYGLHDMVLNELQNTLNKILIGRTHVCCGVSDIFKTPEKLQEAIDQARNRCTLQFYEPERLIFIKCPVSGNIIPDEEKFQIQYMRSLLNQDFQTAYSRVEALINSIDLHRPVDIFAIKKLLLSATVSFLHFVNDVSDEVDEWVEQIKNKIMKSQNFLQLTKVVKDVFEPIICYTNKSTGLTAPVRQAIAYMELHYSEKITLGKIAELVYFSPEHFSRIFSKETGVNYVTHLNNLRMKHAIDLLESTNLKVYEIADKVGFSSLSYFSTAFKKKFGQNPYEYQVNYQRGKYKALNVKSNM